MKTRLYTGLISIEDV